jgi:hypothetical protein
MLFHVPRVRETPSHLKIAELDVFIIKKPEISFPKTFALSNVLDGIEEVSAFILRKHTD